MAMKESGIEWVGSIPDTWDVIPNKSCIKRKIYVKSGLAKM